MTALLISLANSSTSTHRESNKLLLYGVIIYFYLEWLICIDKLFFYLKKHEKCFEFASRGFIAVR